MVVPMRMMSSWEMDSVFCADAQRFGLRTYAQSDHRDIVRDYLTLLHAHGVDFHASLRLLTSFDPTKAGEGKYARVFAANLIGECTINLPAEQVDKAIDEVEGWLSVYARRVVQAEEVQAWKDAAAGETGDWVQARRAAMEGVNPRFVLRQWVLEELIAQLEGTGVEGIAEGRAKLARVLDVSPARCARALNSARTSDRLGPERRTRGRL